jgi:hypothetical protein
MEQYCTAAVCFLIYNNNPTGSRTVPQPHPRKGIYLCDMSTVQDEHHVQFVVPGLQYRLRLNHLVLLRVQ